ncbi:13323_t:CDS:2, partial [Racocetra fulgida]
TKISRSNRSVFVRDISQLSILPEHGFIENALQEQNPVYIRLYVTEIDSDVEKKTKSDNKSLKRKAMLLESEGWETVQSIVQQLGQKLKSTTSNLQNTCKKLSQTQAKILTLQELLENESNSSSDEEIYSNSDNESEEMTKTLKELIQHLITKGKLGSSIFINFKIRVNKLSIKIIVTCYCCQTKSFYGNEISGVNFSDIIAAAGLAGGVNHEEWSTMLCLYRIIRQSGKSQYFQNQKKFFNEIKNTAEASANNALHMAYFYIKSVYAAVARLQNSDIESPTDNDLYLMQIKICTDYLSDKHQNCWPEICWKVKNPEIQLVNPNLIKYTQNQVNDFKEFLKKNTKLLPKQSLITTIRTSMNESFNRVKLNYADKKYELIKIGIPAAAIFATSNQSLDIQEKIFSEVAVGIIKVLWATPEKFIESSKFRRFLHNVFQTRQIKEEFPSAPLLLLTATCSYQEASELATILNRTDLK